MHELGASPVASVLYARLGSISKAQCCGSLLTSSIRPFRPVFGAPLHRPIFIAEALNRRNDERLPEAELGLVETTHSGHTVDHITNSAPC
jgi:hypothetical protein